MPPPFQPPSSPDAARRFDATPGELFRAFAGLGLTGFGGVLSWARRMLVDRRGWLDDREFAELLALGQILPGPNICNVAAMLGWRAAGWRGAAAAVSGLLGPPCVVALALAALYRRFSGVAAVRGALHGMAAVAAGLVLLTALKLARAQPRTGRALSGGACAWAAVGVLKWPLGWVLLALIPAMLIAERYAWRRR